MAGLVQGTAVERAAGLFTSLAAQGQSIDLAAALALAEEHGMSRLEAIDALAFLEATGLVALATRIEILARGRA